MRGRRGARAPGLGFTAREVVTVTLAAALFAVDGGVLFDAIPVVFRLRVKRGRHPVVRRSFVVP